MRATQKGPIRKHGSAKRGEKQFVPKKSVHPIIGGEHAADRAKRAENAFVPPLNSVCG
jgi:hypothetical protein